MKWTQIESGSVYAAGHQLLTALGDEADGPVTQINSDPAFVERLAKFAICGGYNPSTSQKHAREIMGKNFFGVKEAINEWHLNFPNDLAHLGLCRGGGVFAGGGSVWGDVLRAVARSGLDDCRRYGWQWPPVTHCTMIRWKSSTAELAESDGVFEAFP